MACLKRELIAKCGGGNPGFESDLGCRFHHNFANGRAIIKFEEEVLMVLRECEKGNRNHKNLIDLLESSQWSRIRLELSIPILVWVILAGPMHSKISGTLSYGQMKAEFEKALEIAADVMKARSSFQKALDLAWGIELQTEGITRDALVRVRHYWSALDSNIKLEINRVTNSAFEQATQKLKSDWEVVKDLPIKDEVEMVWNNRRVESSFGFLKSVDRKSF